MLKIKYASGKVFSDHNVVVVFFQKIIIKLGMSHQNY